MRNVHNPDNDSRTLRGAPARRAQGPRSGAGPYASGVIGVVLGIGYVIVAGTPSLTGEWDLGSLIIGATITGAGLWASASAWARTSSRVRRIGVGSAIGIVALLGIGAGSQLVIDGTPVLSTSKTAEAHRLVEQLHGDILVLGRRDALLAAGQADARARYNDYEPAAAELRRISGRWARVDLGDLPDPDLIEVVQHVKTGATFGAQALELRYVLITEPDSRTEASMRENRSAFMSETLAAGAKLKPLAEKYKVETSPDGGLE